MMGDAPARRQLAERGAAYAASNSWDLRKNDYLNLVDSLCGAARPAVTVEASAAEATHAH